MSGQPAASATQAKVDDINEMLLLCGQSIISALDTDGTSKAAEAERYYDQAKYAILNRGWHCNTEKFRLEPDGDDQIAAPTGTLRLDTCDEHEERFDVTLRDGNVYWLNPSDPDAERGTADWADANLEYLRVEVVLDLETRQLGVRLRRAIVLEAAVQYLRGKLGKDGSPREQRLTRDAAVALAAAVQEDTQQSNINMLRTTHASRIRGWRGRYV